jgi:hypothetical protein
VGRGLVTRARLGRQVSELGWPVGTRAVLVMGRRVVPLLDPVPTVGTSVGPLLVGRRAMALMCMVLGKVLAVLVPVASRRGMVRDGVGRRLVVPGMGRGL